MHTPRPLLSPSSLSPPFSLRYSIEREKRGGGRRGSCCSDVSSGRTVDGQSAQPVSLLHQRTTAEAAAVTSKEYVGQKAIMLIIQKTQDVIVSSGRSRQERLAGAAIAPVNDRTTAASLELGRLRPAHTNTGARRIAKQATDFNALPIAAAPAVLGRRREARRRSPSPPPVSLAPPEKRRALHGTDQLYGSIRPCCRHSRVFDWTPPRKSAHPARIAVVNKHSISSHRQRMSFRCEPNRDEHKLASSTEKQKREGKHAQRHNSDISHLYITFVTFITFTIG